MLGLPGENLPGIHHLRHWAELEAVWREIAAGAEQAVALGGSFLGMEIAMTPAELGMAVTVVEMGGLLLRHVDAPEILDYAGQQAEARGIALLLEQRRRHPGGEDRAVASPPPAGTCPATC